MPELVKQLSVTTVQDMSSLIPKKERKKKKKKTSKGDKKRGKRSRGR